jgi:hypothetical protein
MVKERFLILPLQSQFDDTRIVDMSIEEQLKKIAKLHLPDAAYQCILSILSTTWNRTKFQLAAGLDLDEDFLLFDEDGSSDTLLSDRRTLFCCILSSFTPAIALQKLGFYPRWEIRYLVALHERTPEETRQRLSQDGNRYVRAMAQACLHETPHEERRNDSAHLVKIFE